MKAGSTGLRQIADALAARDEVTALHIVAHGWDGHLRLGDLTISAETLEEHRAALERIGSLLQDGTDILLYGCNVAATEYGQAFVSSLAAITGADVAASGDLTGAAAFGGDWDLEFRAGRIEVELIASEEFDGVLSPTWAPSANPFTGISALNRDGNNGSVVLVGDFDTDGDVDVFAFDTNALPTGLNPGGQMLLNGGSGNFTEVRGTASDPFAGLVNSYTNGSGSTFTINAPALIDRDAFVADFDGDGDLDILNRGWNYNSGSKYFETQMDRLTLRDLGPLIPSQEFPRSIATAITVQLCSSVTSIATATSTSSPSTPTRYLLDPTPAGRCC
ncbi:hypothetical protein GCM10011322_38040 [Salinarimonas ramus]|uniref:DUF4347 domain-containing protein n=1 Tax=Salinarimonas ramus TaxID=690164 RepID=A0A917QEU6_9HYPH|nr:hypothetical protein GCM10011322_38040 [Salinarimonas ramus]